MEQIHLRRIRLPVINKKIIDQLPSGGDVMVFRPEDPSLDYVSGWSAWGDKDRLSEPAADINGEPVEVGSCRLPSPERLYYSEQYVENSGGRASPSTMSTGLYSRCGTLSQSAKLPLQCCRRDSHGAPAITSWSGTIETIAGIAATGVSGSRGNIVGQGLFHLAEFWRFGAYRLFPVKELPEIPAWVAFPA